MWQVTPRYSCCLSIDLFCAVDLFLDGLLGCFGGLLRRLDALGVGRAVFAVAVSVPVAISVAVGAALAADVVEHGADQVRVGAFELVAGALELGCHGLAAVDDQDDAVDQRRDDLGVRHQQDRRSIEDHVVVFLADFLQELLEAVGPDELRRVHRLAAGGDDVEMRDVGLDQELPPVGALADDVA